MLANLYAIQKTRKPEFETDALRNRHSVASGVLTGVAGPVFNWQTTTLSRLVTAARSGAYRVDPTPVHSPLLDCRGPR